MQQGWSAADWLQYLLSFAFVIALLLGLLWTLRKLQGGQAGPGGLLRRKSGRLQLLETLSIGPRQKLALVSVDGRDVLLGITASSISALQPWHTDAPASAPHSTRPVAPDAAVTVSGPASAAAAATDSHSGPASPAQEQALNVDDESIRSWLLGKERQS